MHGRCLVLSVNMTTTSFFCIECEHDDHKFFLTTYMGRPYSVSSPDSVPVCNVTGNCVKGSVKLSCGCDFVGNTWNHSGDFTVVNQ